MRSRRSPRLHVFLSWWIESSFISACRGLSHSFSMSPSTPPALISSSILTSPGFDALSFFGGRPLSSCSRFLHTKTGLCCFINHVIFLVFREIPGLHEPPQIFINPTSLHSNIFLGDVSSLYALHFAQFPTPLSRLSLFTPPGFLRRRRRNLWLVFIEFYGVRCPAHPRDPPPLPRVAHSRWGERPCSCARNFLPVTGTSPLHA